MNRLPPLGTIEQQRTRRLALEARQRLSDEEALELERLQNARDLRLRRVSRQLAAARAYVARLEHLAVFE